MGKGSGRRQNRDDKAYSDNWDRIFGKSKNVEDILFPADSKPIKAIDPTPRCAEPFCSCEEGRCEARTKFE